MRKSTKKSSRRAVATDHAATIDVVSQLEYALRYPQATLIGAVVGGVVPWFARTLAHVEVPAAWTAGHHTLAMVMITVVLGCACFSALTVYKFGRATFGDSKKALGFVLAIEGVMLVSQGATSSAALAILIVINALANGSAIAMARDVTCKRRDADARRVATRARSRASEKSPIEVVNTEVPAATPTRCRAARSASNVVTHQWAAAMDDVQDAEIVSEQRLLS